MALPPVLLETDERELEARLTEDEEALALFDQMLQSHSVDVSSQVRTVEKISSTTKRHLNRWVEWLVLNKVDWLIKVLPQ